MPLTASQPKCFTEIAGLRLIDWTLNAFRENGLADFVFVGGYLIDRVRVEYPGFTFVENTNWSDTNILYSLMTAGEHLRNGFYSTYTDTLFRPSAVASLKESSNDITLVMDTLWRERYRFRSQHPEHDAEKMTVSGDRVTRLSREISSEDADGEFTGVLKMSLKGAGIFLESYNQIYGCTGGGGGLVGPNFLHRAYLIELLDKMLQSGVSINCVTVPGEYHEIDTLEDHTLARESWK